MKKLILTTLIILILSLSLAASQFESNYNQFDNLLFTGDFDKLKIELQNFQTSESQNFTEYDTIIVEKYERLLAFKALIDPNDPKMLQNFITGKKAEANSFAKTFAGERASECYRKFLTYADEQDYIEACKYYFIADYFRNQNIESQLTQSKIIYKKAQALYNEESYPEVISLIEENSFDAGNNITLIQNQDSLNTLKENATSQQKRIDDQEFLWKRKEKIEKKLFVSLGLKSVSQPAHDNFRLDVSREGFTTFVNVESVPKDKTAGLSGEILSHVSDHFALGGEIVYTKFKYKNVFDKNLIFFDFDYSTFTAHLKTVYFVKSFVGIRPYIGAGIGFFHAKRENTDVKVLLNANNVTTITFLLPSRTITTTQSLIEFGFQVVYNRDSKFYLNFKTSFYNNFDSDEEIFNKYYSLISANIGFMY